MSLRSSHLPGAVQSPLQPRKTPVQARSAASVDAMLEATLQVLVAVGKERLTTTRVAERAGVSVGTLYQYFPNKSSLLQAALRRHFDGIAGAVMAVCAQEWGGTLEAMGAAMAEAFLAAKMADGKQSAALYAVASDVEGLEIARELQGRMHVAFRELLLTASDGAPRDVGLTTTVLQGMMGGVSRQLLESELPAAVYEDLQRELRAAVTAYLRGCARQPRR